MAERCFQKAPGQDLAKNVALETVLLQIEMGRGRVKIGVKIIVLETGFKLK